MLFLGAVNVDFVVRADRLPAPGETVVGDEFLRPFGGKGANQAVAAARLGAAPVQLIAAVGADPLGADCLASLRGEGIDCRHVETVAGEAFAAGAGAPWGSAETRPER